MLEKTLANLLPKTVEYTDIVGWAPGGERILQKSSRDVRADCTGNSGGVYFFKVEVGGYTVTSFNVRSYPSCCAMYQLNDFMYRRDTVPNEFLFQCWNAFFKAWDIEKEGVHGISNFKRVLINFVESYPESEDGNPHDPLRKIPALKEERIVYKLFWDWAKTQRHMQYMRFYNQNSQNAILTTEVVI